MRMQQIVMRSLMVTVVLLFCSAAVAMADDAVVAKVVMLRGTVAAIDADGRQRTLAPQAPVLLFETIRTGPCGRIQLLFLDQTIVSLGENSQMNIADYVWRPEQKDGQLKLCVHEGTFRVLGGLLARHVPEHFTTETPIATIGIRGSLYLGYYESGYLNVQFLGGRGVDIYNDQGVIALRQADRGAVVTRNSAPTPQAKADVARLTSISRQLDTIQQEVWNALVVGMPPEEAVPMLLEANVPPQEIQEVIEDAGMPGAIVPSGDISVSPS